MSTCAEILKGLNGLVDFTAIITALNDYMSACTVGSEDHHEKHQHVIKLLLDNFGNDNLDTDEMPENLLTNTSSVLMRIMQIFDLDSDYIKDAFWDIYEEIRKSKAVGSLKKLHTIAFVLSQILRNDNNEHEEIGEILEKILVTRPRSIKSLSKHQDVYLADTLEKLDSILLELESPSDCGPKTQYSHHDVYGMISVPDITAKLCAAERDFMKSANDGEIDEADRKLLDELAQIYDHHRKFVASGEYNKATFSDTTANPTQSYQGYRITPIISDAGNRKRCEMDAATLLALPTLVGASMQFLRMGLVDSDTVLGDDMQSEFGHATVDECKMIANAIVAKLDQVMKNPEKYQLGPTEMDAIAITFTAMKFVAAFTTTSDLAEAAGRKAYMELYLGLVKM